MQRMLGDVLSLLKRGTIGSTNSNLINRDVSSNSDVVELLDGSTSPHSSTLANKVRGSIASALWALARTPALVDAIEHEETKHGEEKQLSYILRKLGGDEVVQDSTMAKESIEEAEAYLAATSMPVNGYMEVCLQARPGPHYLKKSTVRDPRRGASVKSLVRVLMKN